jgi:hypothetical protein
LALVLAPLALAGTHGPAAVVEAGVSAALDPDHGHAHDWDQLDAPHHDASDHDHSVALILSGSGTGQLMVIEEAGADAQFVWMPQRPEGPRRPPRESAV